MSKDDLMGKLPAYFHLVRPANLAIIILTQALFWCCIVLPVYSIFSRETTLDLFKVGGIIAATVLIAAGGYVINDYYDLPIDLVNKPERVIISREVSDNAAFNYYMILTASGLLAALAVAWSLGRISLVLLPVVIASLLWFYAQRFKRTFLIGNLVVSFSTASVIFILLLFEVDWESNSVVLGPEVNEILKFGSGYMIFAFLMTMLREIVKDMEDREGDIQFECRTLPVVWGIAGGRAAAMIFLASVLFGLGWLLSNLIRFGNYPAAAYVLVFLIMPGVLTGARILRSSQSSQFRVASNGIKAMMVFGIITMVYVAFILGSYA